MNIKLEYLKARYAGAALESAISSANNALPPKAPHSKTSLWRRLLSHDSTHDCRVAAWMLKAMARGEMHLADAARISQAYFDVSVQRLVAQTGDPSLADIQGIEALNTAAHQSRKSRATRENGVSGHIFAQCSLITRTVDLTVVEALTNEAREYWLTELSFGSAASISGEGAQSTLFFLNAAGGHVMGLPASGFVNRRGETLAWGSEQLAPLRESAQHNPILQLAITRVDPDAAEEIATHAPGAMTRAVASEWMRQKPFLIHSVPRALLTKDVLETALSRYGDAIGTLDDRLLDRDLVISAVRSNPNAMLLAPSHLISERVFEEAVAADRRLFHKVPSDYRTAAVSLLFYQSERASQSTAEAQHIENADAVESSSKPLRMG